MTLSVQKILLTCGPDALQELSIDLKRHPRYPNLVHLSYHQFESPMEEKAVRECRGLILDSAAGWRPVSFPYEKFFNLGEKHASEIDWDTARIFEKLDGSLLTMYWWDGSWHVSTTGTPDADTRINDTGFTYQQVFWQLVDRTLRDSGKKMEDVFHSAYCYMFELVGPGNRIVVRYNEWELYLHGARGMMSLQEVEVDMLRASEYFLTPTQHLMAESDQDPRADVLWMAEQLDPVVTEGFVVVDRNFNRLKVKCPRYVELHHLKSNLSWKRMLEVVRRGESPEFLTYFPEWRNEFEKIEITFNVLADQIDRDWKKFKKIDDRKDFAQKVEKLPTKHALFAIKSGKATTARDWLQSLHFPALERLFSAFFQVP